MPFLRKLGLGQYLRRGTAANRQKQIDFSRKLLRAWLASSPETSERRDIIYFLQKARDPETGQGYSQQELVGEVTLLLGAGTDTANSALAATFYFLVHHPDVLASLTADIRNAFTNVEAIVSGPILQKITAEHFEDPFTYNPSRWILHNSPGARDGEGVADEVLAQQKKAFVPFSLGPCACIGRNVALLELEICIARAVWLFDVRPAPGMEEVGMGPYREYKIQDNCIVGKEGPVLKFRGRGLKCRRGAGKMVK
ncbi:hypothetical protein MMC25_004933 [Agyrium rufum]|nr:hypothetical protein [Agyrium rufum]